MSNETSCSLTDQMTFPVQGHSQAKGHLKVTHRSNKKSLPSSPHTPHFLAFLAPGTEDVSGWALFLPRPCPAPLDGNLLPPWPPIHSIE